MKTKDLLLFAIVGAGAYYFVTSQQNAALRTAEQSAGGGTQAAGASTASGGDLATAVAGIAAGIFTLASSAFSPNAKTN